VEAITGKHNCEPESGETARKESWIYVFKEALVVKEKKEARFDTTTVHAFLVTGER
jgi:hypothetical protein